MEQNKKCPQCGKGTMKAVPNTEPLRPDVPREKEMQAACDECGYQDDFIRFYPVGE
jgi:ribosomal protein S27AE